MKYSCIRCGQQFEAKHKTAVCEKCHTAVCVVCGKEFELQYPWTQVTCSAKCRGIYRRQSGIAKKAAEKSKNTFIEKYNVNNPSQLQKFHKVCKYCGKEFETTSPRKLYCDDIHYGPCPVCGTMVEIKDMSIGPQACSEKCRQVRIMETCIQKYGHTTSVNSEYCRNKSKQTCMEKYGVPHYSMSDEYKQKYRTAMIDKYGVTSPLKSDIVKQKLEQTCMKKYGVPFNCMTPQCRSSYRTISKINQSFLDMLDANNIEYSTEFPISRRSFDFKIGNILVEIDPTITHNAFKSIFPDIDPLSLTYHTDKTKLAEENGYRCIHVWDWDNWENIIDLVKPKTRIYARKCSLSVISKKIADEFTTANHIAGRCNGQNVAYGLFYDSELVEVMTFGKPRYNNNYDHELLRLCTKRGVAVIGGASKLFAEFKRSYPNNSVISYCDLSKFNGSVYEKIGMELSHVTSPAKIWSKGNKKITDNLLRQRGYDQLFGTCYGKGTSNEQLMLDHGWLPVYDCGQNVYHYIPECNLL